MTGNEPAHPSPFFASAYSAGKKPLELTIPGPGPLGLTKRERACIELRIPESGVDWLDVLIAKAQRRDLAVLMRAAQAEKHENRTYDPIWANEAVISADTLLATLAKAAPNA